MDSIPIQDIISVVGEPTMRGLDFSDYRKWENEIATPKLIALGYAVGEWATGERDSFGPLSRYIVVSKPGDPGPIKLVYG